MISLAGVPLPAVVHRRRQHAGQRQVLAGIVRHRHGWSSNLTRRWRSRASANRPASTTPLTIKTDFCPARHLGVLVLTGRHSRRLWDRSRRGVRRSCLTVRRAPSGPRGSTVGVAAGLRRGGSRGRATGGREGAEERVLLWDFPASAGASPTPAPERRAGSAFGS